MRNFYRLCRAAAMGLAFAAAIFGAAAASAWAEGPSFDCAKAKTPVERIICDPDQGEYIARLDLEVSRAYAEKRGNLNGKAAEELIKSQRLWLKRRSKDCYIPETGGIEDLHAYQTGCLQDMYQTRLAELRLKPIELLYSAEDRLCKPLYRAMNGYLKKDPANFSFFYAFPKLAEEAGISDVPWVDVPDDLPRRKWEVGLMPRHKLFRANVTGGNDTRLVSMQYFAGVGDIHYETHVWILKPGTEFSGKTLPVETERGGEFDPEVDPEIVDLKIEFYGEYPDWQTKYKQAYIDNIGALNSINGDIANLFIDVNLGVVAKFDPAQDVFMFDGAAYFIAGNTFHGVSGVYRITPDMKISIVCIAKGYTYWRAEK